jgi:hypothetical protein
MCLNNSYQLNYTKDAHAHTLKLYVDRVRVCLVFICHFVAIEQLQSCQEGFHSMRLVSVCLCLVRIVEVTCFRFVSLCMV